MPGSSSATLKRVTDKFTEYFASKKKTIFQRYQEQNELKNKAQKSSESCGRCGKERHTDWKRCPATKAACNKCRKISHWEKMCKTKKVRRVEEQEDSEDSDTSPIFLRMERESTQDSREFALRAFVKEFVK
ncbi:hypothetical protein ALC56_07507 [Trachymyrmex septentrionalis]|uniref:GATA-type domain-containing protein n=1 Tax=Trachymyrmex septentrionalis TaxID=34720 RepID=A0A195FD30_9HYME|nr:hypothetical protein ALC56_07507 [Trachymyrmex septentrionalis]